MKAPAAALLGPHCGGTTVTLHKAALWLCCTRLCYGYVMAAALLGPHCGGIMVMLHKAALWLSCTRLCYGYVMAAAKAAASARREAVSGLTCQPGEKKHFCSSYCSSSRLEASWLTPCLPWVQ